MTLRLSKEEFEDRFNKRSAIYWIAIGEEAERFRPLVKRLVIGDQSYIDVTEFTGRLIDISIKRLIDLVYRDFEDD